MNELDNQPEQPVTANDLARLIRRMAHIFEVGDLGNYQTSDALLILSDHLHSLGSISVHDLTFDREPARPGRTRPGRDYGTIPLDSVKVMLRDVKMTKSSLIDLAKTRFGIPESRLRRLTIAEVLDTVSAAASHEESLDIISKNAAASGRARQS